MHQLLALVHDGHLWLREPILIDDMLICRITTLPHQGANPNDAFVGKFEEKKLAYEMKNDYDIVKKSWGYDISSINDEAVCFYASILARKIMKKCQVDEVLTPVVSLVS